MKRAKHATSKIFGSSAVVAQIGFRPGALRPHLSMRLPLSDPRMGYAHGVKLSPVAS